jgi:hypothetical protein
MPTLSSRIAVSAITFLLYRLSTISFNPSYIIIESYYRDSSSDKNIIKESRYGEKVIVTLSSRIAVSAITFLLYRLSTITFSPYRLSLIIFLPRETTDDKSDRNALFTIQLLAIAPSYL